MAWKKKSSVQKSSRRHDTDEFREEAVQLPLDGYTAPQVVERLGISYVNDLNGWKQEQREQSGPVASSLEANAQELEADLRRVERERGSQKHRWKRSSRRGPASSRGTDRHVSLERQTTVVGGGRRKSV